MSKTLAGQAPRRELPLKFVGGDLSLDLINTVDWTQVGLQNERLSDFARALEWAERSGALSSQDVRILRDSRAAHPRRVGAAMKEIHRVRFVLKRLMTEFALGPVSPAAAEEFDALLARAMPGLTIALRTDSHRGAASRKAAWAWRDIGATPLAVVWSAVIAAGRLLTSPDAGQIRVCAGPDCGWMFVDRSRNGLRRWCEMETCGTLQKTRTRRARRS